MKTKKRPTEISTEGTGNASNTEVPGSLQADLAADTLQSWKEIAGFIDRDERTAMRWAKEKGMPVRRIPGGNRGRVHSTRAEISAWLAGSPPPVELGLQLSSPPSARTVKLLFVIVAISVIAGIGFVILRPRSQSLPSRVGFSVDSIRAFSDDGRMLWSHQFPGVFVPDVVNGAEISRLGELARIADLRGDGRREVVMVAPLRKGPNRQEVPSIEVDCFSSSGALLWSYVPHSTFRFGDHELNGPWGLDDLIISRRAKGYVIYAAFVHATWGNSFVVEIDPATGSGVVRFVNTGTTHVLNEVQSSRGTYLLMGGFNNEFDGADLAVIDERKPFAASPQTVGTRHKCIDCPPGDPDYYLVFPRSELNHVRGLYENYLAGLRIEGHDLQASKRETDPNTQAFYLLHWDDPGFHVVSLRFDSAYDMEHRELEKTGRLGHSLDSCPERLRPAPIKMWTPQEGWKELAVRRVQ